VIALYTDVVQKGSVTWTKEMASLPARRRDVNCPEGQKKYPEN